MLSSEEEEEQEFDQIQEIHNEDHQQMETNKSQIEGYNPGESQ